MPTCNGWVDGDGELLPTEFEPWAERDWPDGILQPSEIWTETDPNNPDTDGDGATDGFSEDTNFDGLIEGDVNSNRLYDADEVWSETDPLNEDTDGDGLPDGWEIDNGPDPLDNGVDNFRTAIPNDPQTFTIHLKENSHGMAETTTQTKTTLPIYKNSLTALGHSKTTRCLQSLLIRSP